MSKRTTKKTAYKPRMVRYTIEEIRRMPIKFDKAKFDAITDEEIARQIENDPDVAPDMTTLPESWRIPVPSVLRSRLGMTQKKMADVLHISLGTWRNWEQGRSIPYGPAFALLRVLDKNPKAVLDALNPPRD